MRARRLAVGVPLLALGVPLLALGCGETGAGADPIGDAAEAAPDVWELAEEPSRVVGVREGDEAHELHRARDATFFGDGRLAVLNAGTGEVRFYDEGGTYVGAVGGEGDGPGEFRWPTGLRLRGDTLVVLDERSRSRTLFSADGAVLGRRPIPPHDEEAFPAGGWITGRTWVAGAETPSERRAVAGVLAGLPRPDTAAPFRFALLADDGRVWTAESPPPWPDGATWTVREDGGAAVAAIETPPRFLPTRVSSERVVGIARDSLDVQRVEVWAVRGGAAGATSGAPPADGGSGADAARGADGSAAGTSPGAAAPNGEAAARMGTVRGLVRMLAGHQERFYAGRMAAGERGRYARNLEELFESRPLEVPSGVRVELVAAGSTWWLGLAEVPEDRVRCIMNFGAPHLSGVPIGQAVCWQEESRPEAGGLDGGESGSHQERER